MSTATPKIKTGETLTWTCTQPAKADFRPLIGKNVKSARTESGLVTVLSVVRQEHVSAAHAEDRGHYGAYWITTLTGVAV